MIYTFDNKSIDLSKLEYVSDIITTPKDEYLFRFQINTHSYEVHFNQHFSDIKLMRDNLISVWEKYLKEK